MIDNLYIDKLIIAALHEDMPMGDITTDGIIGDADRSLAVLIAKETGIIAGMDVAKRVFELLDPGAALKALAKDGARVKAGDMIAEVEGRTGALLKGERTALNLLQRMSGIATLTGRFADEVKGLPVKIVDTRKTMPGLRFLDKYAVNAGGGANHRFGLSDGVLIKDNHISAAGSITKAVQKARGRIPHTVKIEVETETLAQVREALEAGADIIMLDNMPLETMREAVAIIGGRAEVEASGNVTLDTVRAIAETGVDIISVGALTHSVKAFDISLKFR